MAERKRIESIEELKKLAQQEGGCDCFIALNFGLKSSKHVTFNDKKFYVFNFIDDTEVKLTEEEMRTETNIADAIVKGALILD